jgi:uncharacterized protein (TIGR02588 family)
VLVSTVVAYLVWDMTREAPAATSIEVELGAPVAQGAAFAVPVRARNRGATAAENTLVEVTLTIGGREERAQVTLPFLPRDAPREGWVTFSEDPRRGRLSSRVIGYTVP